MQSYPVIPRIIRPGLFLQPVSRSLQETGAFPLQPLPIPREAVASLNVNNNNNNGTCIALISKIHGASQ